MALDITEGGLRCLAVPVGSPARGTAISRILALKGSPGWVVAPPSVKEWRFTGVTEKSGATMLYGPWLPVQPLASILELPASEALPFLIRLVDALQLLKDRRLTLFPLQTDAVLFCEDGAVLFLPADIMRELRGLRPFSMNKDTFESMYNPDLRDEKMVSFALGCLLYRLITGTFPFTGDSVEDMHEQMRKLEILAPMANEASPFIMAALSRSRSGVPSIDDWAEILRVWNEKSTLQLTARTAPASASPLAQKRFRRRLFWEKNWRTALIIAGVVIVVGAGLGSVFKGVFAPRVTRGYSPRQIVQTFYESMNRLDQTTMGACVIDGAGKAEISEVTNLYVISRVSMGYEGKSTIIAADEWDKEGKPTIPSPRTIYGVTDLSVAQEKPEPAPVFLVSYDKWTPLPVDESAQGRLPVQRFQGQAVQDRVFLKLDRGDWVIFRIERLRSDSLP